MVDRIEKLDPKLYQVQETDKDRGRRQQAEEEEEGKKREKDKFDRTGRSWKKLIPEASTKLPTEAPPKWMPSPSREEVSLSMSQRVLVLWGVLDPNGKPRVPVIATYVALIAVIAFSTILIIRMLWR